MNNKYLLKFLKKHGFGTLSPPSMLSNEELLLPKGEICILS